jgi:hypothetical protein
MKAKEFIIKELGEPLSPETEDVFDFYADIMEKYAKAKAGHHETIVMWRSVEEQLPEVPNKQYSERLLIFGNRNGITDIHIGVYHLNGKFHSYGKEVDASHWQPLPKPPQAT